MQRWLLHHIEDEDEARERIAEHQREWEAGARLNLAIVESADAARAENIDPIGSVSLRRMEPGAETAEVGFWVSARIRGLAVAPRAVEALLRWALEEEWAENPPSTINLIHTEGNDASCRVAEKLGFEFKELLPPHPLKYPLAAHLHVRRY